MRKLRIAEMDYGPAEAHDLRERIIELRDSALAAGSMDVALLLSHAAAFMYVSIPIIWPPQ